MRSVLSTTTMELTAAAAGVATYSWRGTRAHLNGEWKARWRPAAVEWTMVVILKLRLLKGRCALMKNLGLCH